VEEHFQELHNLAKKNIDEYLAVVAACANLPFNKWQTQGIVGEALYNTRNAFSEARTCFRNMGEQANVPLEPECQTQLADATLAVDGVLACGVPGAGGYDAIFAIVLSPSVAKEVDGLWTKWEKMIVLPLILKEDARGVTLETNFSL